jgi:hypothetical protein
MDATTKETIKRRLGAGETGVDLAREYGVSRQYISLLKGNTTGRTNKPNFNEMIQMRMQIAATISLISQHVIPELEPHEQQALYGYLRRLALSCHVVI